MLAQAFFNAPATTSYLEQSRQLLLFCLFFPSCDTYLSKFTKPCHLDFFLQFPKIRFDRFVDSSPLE